MFKDLFQVLDQVDSAVKSLDLLALKPEQITREIME